MESNQNNFAASIASGERSWYFSEQAQSATMCDSKRFDSVGCMMTRLPANHTNHAKITVQQIESRNVLS